MSKAHLLQLGVGEPFRLVVGGLVWHRAPDRIGADKVPVARVIPPDEVDPIDARHLPNLFVFPTRPDWQDRSPDHGR